jgi:hypothetical protein
MNAFLSAAKQIDETRTAPSGDRDSRSWRYGHGGKVMAAMSWLHFDQKSVYDKPHISAIHSNINNDW